MKFNDKYPWYLLDIAVFVALNVALLVLIKPSQADLEFFTPWRVLILGVAVYRAANIISNEVITKPIRAPFVKEETVEAELPNGQTIDKKIEKPLSRGFRGSFGNLIHCASCSGVWVAAILVYSYLQWPNATWIIAILLSLSAVERFLTLTYDRFKPSVQYHAKNEKQG